jgi:hypothetical protein
MFWKAVKLLAFIVEGLALGVLLGIALTGE